MSQGKRQLPALTGIRFFLAFWVVVYHQVPPLETILGGFPFLHRSAHNILHTGYTAVTAFFVLSGFVLAYNYDLASIRIPKNLTRFGIARFSRIYPAYFVGLIAFLPLAAYRIWSGLETESGEWLTFTFLLNLLLLQAWIPLAALSWNFPGWSLSNEAFFYLCFPFAGRLLWRAERLRSIWVLLGVLWMASLCVPLIAILIPIHGVGDIVATSNEFGPDVEFWANLIRYNPLIRLSEFCIGILLAKLYRRLPEDHPLWDRGARFYVPGMLVTIAALAFAGSIPYPLTHNGLFVPAFGCIVFGLALEGGYIARLLSTPFLVLLGNASYSMYILHAPIYIWLQIAFRRVLGIETNGWVWFFSYVTAVTAGSCVFFKLLEEPLHRSTKKVVTRWFERGTVVASAR